MVSLEEEDLDSEEELVLKVIEEVVGVAEEEEDIKVEDNLEGIGRIEDNQ